MYIQFDINIQYFDSSSNKEMFVLICHRQMCLCQTWENQLFIPMFLFANKLPEEESQRICNER